MTIAYGTQVKITAEDAGPYKDQIATVTDPESLNADVFDIEGVKNITADGTFVVLKLQPAGDFQSFLAALEEGNDDGSIHLGVPVTDFEVVTA